MKRRIVRPVGKKKYIYLHIPRHPYADCHGYYAEHRFLVEQKIGRYLTSDEVVHHINGDSADNRIENLQLMKKIEHLRHHGKEKYWKNVIEFRFKKGNKAWNKNMKGIHLSPDSEFKKGQLVGKDHYSWKGGVQNITNDCVHIWSGVNQRVRRPRQVYEKCYGKIPKGFVIYHKDGDKNNDDPANLEAISRSELMRRNAPHHTYNTCS